VNSEHTWTLPQRIENVTWDQELGAELQGLVECSILVPKVKTDSDLRCEPGRLPWPPREDMGTGLADELYQSIHSVCDLPLIEHYRIMSSQ
jgi:hypothetical protein